MALDNTSEKGTDSFRAWKDSWKQPLHLLFSIRGIIAELIRDRRRHASTALFIGLVLLLLLGYSFFYMRGLNWAEPFIMHPDEWAVAGKAIDIVKTGDFNPHFFYYPTLPTYIQVGVTVITHAQLTSAGKYGEQEYRKFSELTAREKFYYYRNGRLVNALYAGILMLMLYFLSKQLFKNRWIAFLPVVVTMLFPLLIAQSHYVTPNVIATMFGITVIHFSLLYLDTQKVRHLYIASIMAGLAIGSKYNMAIVALPVFLAILLKLPRKIFWHILLIIITICITFIATTPCVIQDISAVLDDACYQIWHYKWGGHIGAESATPFSHYMSYIWNQGALIFILSLAGMVSLLLTSGRKGLVVISFPLLYIFFLSNYIVVFSRNLLPLMPFIAIGFGEFVRQLSHVLPVVFRNLSSARLKKVITASVLLAACCITLIRPFRLGLTQLDLFIRPYTVQKAQKWIEANIPAGSRFASDTRVTPAVVPLPDEQYRVRAGDVFFSKCYLHYLDRDYLLSRCAATCDKHEWFRRQLIYKMQKNTRTDDSKLVEQFLNENRKSLEVRFPLVHRVEAGRELNGDDIYLFKIPDMRLITLAGADFEPDAVLNKSIEENKLELKEHFPFYWPGTISKTINLEPGEYDIFARARGVYKPGSSIPLLRIQFANMLKRDLKVIFTNNECYVCGTVKVISGGNYEIKISLLNDEGVGHDVFFQELVLAKPLTPSR